MKWLRFGLTIGLVAGAVLASGLAVAEVSNEPPPDSIWSFDSPKAFVPSPSAPTEGKTAPAAKAPAAGDASAVRQAPGAGQDAPSAAPMPRTFQSEQGLRDR